MVRLDVFAFSSVSVLTNGISKKYSRDNDFMKRPNGFMPTRAYQVSPNVPATVTDYREIETFRCLLTIKSVRMDSKFDGFLQ